MNNEELVEQIYNVLVERFGISETLFPQTVEDKNKVVTWKEFIKLVCIDNFSGELLAVTIGLRSSQNLSKYITKFSYSIKLAKPPKEPWKTFLLLLIDTKKCPTCKIVKSLKAFRTNNTRHLGLSAQCRECEAEYTAKVIDHTKEYSIKYRLLNKERLDAYAIAYRINNKEKIAASGKEHYRLNKSLYRAKDAKYRAHKLKATPKWANQEAIKLVYATVPKGYHVDHIIPLQNPLVCGLHCEFNLQHLSAHDNLSKGNKYEP